MAPSTNIIRFFRGHDSLNRHIISMEFRYINSVCPDINLHFHPLFIKSLLIQAIHLRIVFYNFTFRTVTKLLYELARDSKEFNDHPIEDMKKLVKFCMQLSLDYITEEELELMNDDETPSCEC